MGIFQTKRKMTQRYSYEDIKEYRSYCSNNLHFVFTNKIGTESHKRWKIPCYLTLLKILNIQIPNIFQYLAELTHMDTQMSRIQRKRHVSLTKFKCVGSLSCPELSVLSICFPDPWEIVSVPKERTCSNRVKHQGQQEQHAPCWQDVFSALYTTWIF